MAKAGHTDSFNSQLAARGWAIPAWLDVLMAARYPEMRRLLGPSSSRDTLWSCRLVWSLGFCGVVQGWQAGMCCYICARLVPDALLHHKVHFLLQCSVLAPSTVVLC